MMKNCSLLEFFGRGEGWERGMAGVK